MLNDEKILAGQRYFLSKLMEVFATNKSSSVFYKFVQEKTNDSIGLVFEEFLEIERDIREGTSDKSKLKHSLKSSLKSLIFQCENNPLLTKGSSSNDIKNLTSKISFYLNLKESEEENLNLNSLQKSISALSKRFKSIDLIEEYIDFIINTTLSYREVDNLVQCFISELLHIGYSFEYLREWKKEHPDLTRHTNGLSREEVSEKILLFKQLIKKPKKFKIIINTWLPDELQRELNVSKVIRINYEYRNLEGKEEDLVKEYSAKLTFKQAESYQNLVTEITAFDKYKAIEQTTKNLESYLALYRFLFDFNKDSIVSTFCLLIDETEAASILRTDNTDSEIFNKTISSREKDDIRDFLSLRDEVRHANKNLSTNIKQISNSLEIITSYTSVQAPENRLMNHWSSLEYLLNSYEGKSIIGKIIDIIPKVICLYFMKDKLNVLWDKVIQLRGNRNYKPIEIIEKMLSNCSVHKNHEKYDKEKLIKFLSEETHLESLSTAIQEDIVLHREISALGTLLYGGNLLSEINKLHDRLQHDLTRIYRTRNRLAHSENDLTINLDIITIRLNKYVNSLIGTVIHYLKRQPDLYISEILNSIHETYNKYIKDLEQLKKEKKNVIESSDLKNIMFPPYLYL